MAGACGAARRNSGFPHPTAGRAHAVQRRFPAIYRGARGHAARLSRGEGQLNCAPHSIGRLEAGGRA
jgi:hypothetical protein